MTGENQIDRALSEADVAALMHAARVAVPAARLAGLTAFANAIRDELQRLAAIDFDETFPAADFDARWER